MSDNAKALSDVLKVKELVMASAESCTGGMIAASMTDIAGSSSIFDRGFVTYSNESKEEMLGVSSSIIDMYGAVSKSCADAMVIGALNNSNADIAVSVTGIAGPSGGTEGKPVGLVYIGVCLKGREPEITECHFDGSRDEIRKSTCDKALALLIEAAGTV